MTQKMMRPKFLASLALLAFAVAVYFVFIGFAFDYVESKAAMMFITSHRALGESDKFILDIAGQGLAQPWEIVVQWRFFQIGTLIALVFIGGLFFLTWTNRQANPKSEITNQKS